MWAGPTRKASGRSSAKKRAGERAAGMPRVPSICTSHPPVLLPLSPTTSFGSKVASSFFSFFLFFFFFLLFRLQQFFFFLFLLKQFFFFSFFLGPHQRQMGDPRLEAESKLPLLAYSSQQRQVLNLLSEVRDQICILMDTSQVCNSLSHTGTPLKQRETFRKSCKNDTGFLCTLHSASSNIEHITET